jgi:hypothetical protein
MGLCETQATRAEVAAMAVRSQIADASKSRRRYGGRPVETSVRSAELEEVKTLSMKIRSEVE